MTFATLAALAVALSLAIAPALTNQAVAKIEEVVVEEFCQNPSGNRPPGQQEECQGEGQEEVVVKERRNPADKAPPGQNK